MNFFEALIGLAFDPVVTIEELLEEERPRFSFTILLCLVLTIFVPLIAQYVKYGTSNYNLDAVSRVTLALVLAFPTFLILELGAMRLLGIIVDPRKLFALFSFSLTPLVLGIFLIHIFNYLSDGSLTFLKIILSNNVETLPSMFLKIVPIALGIAFLQVVIVFFCGLRFITATHTALALSLTLVSILPFVIALGLSSILGEFILPGTLKVISDVFTSPQALTFFR